MQSPDELRRENLILRDRISRLSAASLRISASLDLDTVLSEVVESSRALTGARYGGIVTIGDSGLDRGLRLFRLHSGRAPRDTGLGQRAAAVRTHPGP